MNAFIKPYIDYRATARDNVRCFASRLTLEVITCSCAQQHGIDEHCLARLHGSDFTRQKQRTLPRAATWYRFHATESNEHCLSLQNGSDFMRQRERKFAREAAALVDMQLYTKTCTEKHCESFTKEKITAKLKKIVVTETIMFKKPNL